jgi:hypothetical protein
MTEQDAVLDLMTCLTPRRPVGVEKIRLGRPGDGGYVMLDDFAGVDAALSYGIETDVSWDSEIADRGIDVHQYDHSVSGPPVTHERFRFFRRMLAGVATEACETLGTTMALLPTGAAGRLILKIDIEGAEWEVFDAATAEELAQFSQIVGEFHGFSGAADAAWRETAQRVLLKLREQFDLVHVHANNFGGLHVVANVPVAEAFELTFANRAIYRTEPSDELFPTPLDQPNWDERPDIFLGTMKFRP